MMPEAQSDYFKTLFCILTVDNIYLIVPAINFVIKSRLKGDSHEENEDGSSRAARPVAAGDGAGFGVSDSGSIGNGACRRGPHDGCLCILHQPCRSGVL